MSQLTPFTDPEVVLATIKPVTDRIHMGLHTLLPDIRHRYFEMKGLPVDKSLHAMMTRYELRHYLIEHEITASDEEDIEEKKYVIQGVANCGLVINGARYILRVLKSQNNELPTPTSYQRLEFYQANLFSFESEDPYPGNTIPPLSLVAAWNATADHKLGSFSIVCPWGQVNNRVEYKWWKNLELPTLPFVAQTSSHEALPLPPEPALDEITPREDSINKILHDAGPIDADTNAKNAE